MKHITKDGKSIKLKDLSDNHLNNIINLIKRRAKGGITLGTGGGVDLNDMWYEEKILYGKEAKKMLKYKKYVKERKRRTKLIESNIKHPIIEVFYMPRFDFREKIVGISKIDYYQQDNGKWVQTAVTNFKFPEEFLEDLEYIQSLSSKLRPFYYEKLRNVFLEGVHDIARYKETGE